MVLKDNLYIITNEDKDKGLFKIRLKDDCFIYAAHFPNLPITPGVCVVQIVKELAELLLGQMLTLKSIKNAKFLKVMQPDGKEFIINITVKKQEDILMSFQSVIIDLEDNPYAKISLQASIEK